MPGENFPFLKCSSSRKDKGISVFEVPAPDKTNDESIKDKRSQKYFFEISCKRSISDKTYAVL